MYKVIIYDRNGGHHSTTADAIFIDGNHRYGLSGVESRDLYITTSLTTYFYIIKESVKEPDKG